MREILKVVLDKQALIELEQNLFGSPGVLNLLHANTESIQKLLVGYHYSEAGQVCNVVLKDSTLMLPGCEGAGSIEVEYQTHYFQACSGNRYDVDNKMVIDFAIIPYKSTLELRGEEIFERMPDSY